MEKESNAPCGSAAWEKQGLEGIATLTHDQLAKGFKRITSNGCEILYMRHPVLDNASHGRKAKKGSRK